MLTVRKPGTYTTEAAFMGAATNQTDCIKYYFDGWYRTLVKAGGRLPPPLWEGPPLMQGVDTTALQARDRWKKVKPLSGFA